MKNLQLHNLRCYIHWNPNATVSDYAREIKASKRLVKLIGEAYDADRRKK